MHCFSRPDGVLGIGIVAAGASASGTIKRYGKILEACVF